MRKDDGIRLRHMLDAAREAREFARGRTRSDLDANRMLTLSLVKAIEIVGEAAARVSADTRSQCFEIPWSDLTGMRHRLIHGYFDVNLDIVWQTVVEDLPSLMEKIERILRDEKLEKHER
jgi:uncharacterized protein with HEPN domain